MKIAIIGSTQYEKMMYRHKSKMERDGHVVKLPCLDTHPTDMREVDILTRNRENIKWADEVHILWDQRSMGTVFDFGMCVALNKPVKIVYLEPKTFVNAMKQWESLTQEEESL